jgi:hypothetical protein
LHVAELLYKIGKRENLGGSVIANCFRLLGTSTIGDDIMIKKHRLAAMTAAAAAILLVSQIAPVQSNSAAAASRIDREPKADETFGRKPVLRRSNDLASRAAELAANGNYFEARRLAEQSGNQTAIKLVEWLYLKDTA